jgi:type III pantothenate kinase
MAIVALDIGNTRIKAGLFDDGKLIDKKEFSDALTMREWLDQIRELDDIVLASVGPTEKVLAEIKDRFRLHIANTKWKHPLKINYESIDTLGIDRLAAVVGAWEKFKEAAIVFDLGSCLTIDYIDEKGVYHGGNISPGWQMRLKAMHDYTANLPLHAAEASEQIFGKNTEKALQLGAFNGLRFEIQRYVDLAKQRNKRINVILTGGNAIEFAKHLKMEIFVLPDIILEGLHKLLHANI